MAFRSPLNPFKRKLDVFLNFRGKDTGNNFVSHLSSSLRREGIDVYCDEKNAPGNNVSVIFERIEQSKMSIVVFSEHYAESTWCLVELLKILECREKSGHKVLPIFYKVEASDVRDQKGSFGAPFLNHEKSFKEDARVEEWKDALRKVSSLLCLAYDGERPESEIVEIITKKTLYMLNNMSPCDNTEITSSPGIESRSKELKKREVEVFVSFRGADTRYTFTSYLLEALKQKGIDALFHANLRRSNDISVLFEKIQQSKMSIVVFSENYANSTRCLEELWKIMHCMEKFGHRVIPIFYKVEASDVREQKGSFGAPFLNPEKTFKADAHKVWEWKDALRKASSLAGLVYHGESPEIKFVDEIVTAAQHMLEDLSTCEIQGFPGIESRSKELEELLMFDNDECVRTIGVLGMAGIGKTTVAHSVYKRNNQQFDGCCFLDNIDNELTVHGVHSLLQKLLYNLTGEENLDVIAHGRLEDCLEKKKLFIVLDDVTHEDQIISFLGKKKLSRKGSRIVITSRDKKLLEKYADATYLVPRLNDVEAMKLFCLRAFPDNLHPVKEFLDLSNSFVQFAEGNPVTLKILGSDLLQRSKSYWTEQLKSLNEEPDEVFYKLLKGSYEEPDNEHEHILVFSCSDNLDMDEKSFTEAISKELQKREITSLTYNLLGSENLDEEMLYRSSVGIMILSQSYASSRESLDHLVEIMEHGKATNLVIVPVYFKVTRADICESEGRFEAAFWQYQNSDQADRVQKWKAAMTEVASISGHEWTKGNQVMLVDEVVGYACLRLFLKNSQNLDRILALLKHSQPSDADFVGIWGMAGIGKTAIAREIYEILASQYDLCYFLQDFDQLCIDKGLRQMRDDFFSKVFGKDKLSICASDTKSSFMRKWFKDKKILVFLDDVSNARDVEAVLGGFGWFSSGHRIILTSRRKQVLEQCKVQELYEMQKLFKKESLRLCKQYLSGESAVILELMRCSSGIPLALKVLCSSVSKQQENDMKNHLQTLRKNPPPEIQDTFRGSFARLNENEKNIFLDLACFFIGEKMDDVVQLLDACGFLTYLGICNLIDESLISLQDNKIEIPVPFEDVGRYIVNEEDDDPCERSRLWDSDAIADVLTSNSGTDAIEGIFLDVSDLTCVLSPTVFNEMYRLRLLKFYFSTSGNECKISLPEGLDSLPDELRLLHWENYSLNYLPQKFNPDNLVELNMPYSDMEKLWEGKKNLERLKKINLSHSDKLTDIYTLSEAKNLEYIDLEGCTSLVDISTSIPCCAKLNSLNMKDCSHLRSFPAMSDLTSLKLLNLSGCSKLEEIQDFAPNLKELYLAGTAIKELPLSIEHLTELVTLDLEIL